MYDIFYVYIMYHILNHIYVVNNCTILPVAFVDTRGVTG